jgi:hypothetical protein
VKESLLRESASVIVVLQVASVNLDLCANLEATGIKFENEHLTTMSRRACKLFLGCCD